MNKETFELINKIAQEHSNKTFGYLTKEDLINEIWLICLLKIDEFTEGRGQLEHFLRVSVKNALVNKYKDITKSVRSPCPRCIYYDPGESPSDCARFGDERYLCNKWRKFKLSTDSRNSLLNVTEQQFERINKISSLDRMIDSELREIVILNIDPFYIHDFNEFLSSGRLSKQKIKKLVLEILRVINQYNIDKNKYVDLTIGGEDARTIQE